MWNGKKRGCVFVACDMSKSKPASDREGLEQDGRHDNDACRIGICVRCLAAQSAMSTSPCGKYDPPVSGARCDAAMLRCSVQRQTEVI